MDGEGGYTVSDADDHYLLKLDTGQKQAGGGKPGAPTLAQRLSKTDILNPSTTGTTDLTKADSLALQLPAGKAKRIDLTLPDDALAIDNALTLLAPRTRTVGMRLQLSPKCQCSTSLAHLLLKLNAADYLFLNRCFFLNSPHRISRALVSMGISRPEHLLW